MIAFEVNDMSCAHCVNTITRAVKAADKDAEVNVDLARHSNGCRTRTRSR